MSPSYLSSFPNLNPASRMFCPITLLLPPTFPYQAPRLGPSSLPQGILLVTFSVVFSVSRTRLTHIFEWIKLWSFWNIETNPDLLTGSWNPSSFIFCILMSLLYSIPTRRNLPFSVSAVLIQTFLTFGPLLTFEMFCLPLVSIHSRSFCEPLLGQFSISYSKTQLSVWLSSSLKSVPVPIIHIVCSFLLPSLCLCGCLYLTKYSSTFKTNSNTFSSKELSMISLNWN